MKILLLVCLLLVLAFFVSIRFAYAAPHWISLDPAPSDTSTNFYYLDSKTRYVQSDTAHEFPFFMIKVDNHITPRYYIIIISCANKRYVIQLAAVGDQMNKPDHWDGPYSISGDSPLRPLINFCATSV